jgi:hypothetical protein
MAPQSSNSTNLTKNEMGGLLEDREIDILHTLTMYMDMLHVTRSNKK